MHPRVPLLEIANLRKGFIFPDGSAQRVIDIPLFVLKAKEELALRGASGSGKTTFLHLIAGILRPDSGSIRFLDQEISGFDEPRRDRLRATAIGYVFQSFNLLAGYTALENVLLGMSFGEGADKPFAEHLLKRVGLEDRRHHFPRQLSTGQQQRVAVARALANRPRLVLADEPTGNLDASNAQAVLALIRDLCREGGAALLLVSHDPEILRDFVKVGDMRTVNSVPDSASGRT